MATRTAALLFRRRAAEAAPKPLQQYVAGLSTAAGHDVLDDGGRSDGGEGNRKQWMELPPFAPLDANAAARAISRGGGGEGACSNATAIRWVRRCCPHMPASLVQKLFRLRKVKRNLLTADTSSIDGITEQLRLRRVLAKDELVPGDILFLPVNIQESSVAEKTKKFGNKNEIDFIRSLEIYKDRNIIVLNKPPGMPVQGGVGIKNSIDVLAPMFEDSSSGAPRLVHRLDRDCSGVLVLGRTQLSASIMHAIFRDKTADALANGTQQVLQRKYVALVMGRPRHPKGLLSAPLAKTGVACHCIKEEKGDSAWICKHWRRLNKTLANTIAEKVVLQDGKSERLTVCAGSSATSVQDALTEYRVIESCPQGYTWLELFPRTGRKHQLRVHCAEVLGTPIVGDYKYGRQAHQNWSPLPMPQAVDEEMLKKRKLPFGLSLGGGSVAEEQPQLHLHCKQMILPDISEAMQRLQSSDADHDFSDLEKLSFVAPLPLHMRLSWEILKSVGK
ncbi:RNA pseudouridine synthase 4, mitochondrial-like [Panicum miliaceum]|uniref:RNA pseudouridine synthase 4, mitochondrial-like n=1 Tax=Panicum miliaceum TaxID=4540 RepID=A0A3L6TF17_PANMI|nr:RNA pseudouridine synthase 4, mitochondrial-like [Panicum miliaceum]